MKSYVRMNLIDEYRKEHGLSVTGFCKRCGISYSTYKKIEEGNMNIYPIAILRIARVLELEMYQILL